MWNKLISVSFVREYLRVNGFSLPNNEGHLWYFLPEILSQKNRFILSRKKNGISLL